MVSLAWRGHRHAAVEHGLRPVEGGLVDQRLEIAACRDATIGALHLANVDPVPQNVAESLRGERAVTPRPQAGFRRTSNHFLRGEPSRGEILERLLHQRTRSGSCTRLLVDHFGALR